VDLLEVNMRRRRKTEHDIAGKDDPRDCRTRMCVGHVEPGEEWCGECLSAMAEDAALLSSLYADYREAKAADEEATRTRNAVSDRLHRAALALMDASGRGSLPAAEWMRAHLAGDVETYSRIAAEYPEDYYRSDPAQWRDPPHPPRSTIHVGTILGDVPVVCDCDEPAVGDVFEVVARVNVG
jgi:hypothetical protein